MEAVKKSTVKPDNHPLGLSEKDLRARHDNLYKIRQACKQLQRGNYVPDQQMRELCHVAPNTWRGYSEKEEFSKYKFTAQGGKIYWGVPECVKKLQEDINGM